jgi:hypothetical protein
MVEFVRVLSPSLSLIARTNENSNDSHGINEFVLAAATAVADAIDEQQGQGRRVVDDPRMYS